MDQKRFPESYKEVLNDIKDYWSLIVVIPPLIGGLFQILELSLISSSYIRFFSVTQALVDGLLFLFFVILLSLAALIAIEFGKMKCIQQRPKWVRETLIFTLIVLLAALFVSLFFGLHLNCKILSVVIIGVLLFTGLISLITFAIPDKFFVAIGRWILGVKKDPENDQKYTSPKKTRLLWLLLIFVPYFYLTHKTILFEPKSLVNKEFVHCFVSSYFPSTERKIRYFNDQYIFVEVLKKNKGNKIFVLPFSKFFDFQDCGVPKPKVIVPTKKERKLDSIKQNPSPSTL